MGFKNIRPLHIMWQEGIEPNQLDGVWHGIVKTLQKAEVLSEFKLYSYAAGRRKNYKNKDGLLNPHQSLDWHIERARQQSKKPGYLNSTVLLNTLAEDPAYNTDAKYDLVIVREPLHYSDHSLRTVDGVGRQKQVAVITIGSRLHLLQPVANESAAKNLIRKKHFSLATQMLAIHELGHVFGLLPGTGNKNPNDQELKDAHCLKDCVMYWQEDAVMYEKIIAEPFCPDCKEKLKQFFLEV